MAQQPTWSSAGVADATGRLELTFSPRGGGRWRATQVTAEMPTGASALCDVRLNGRLISPMVPTGDAAVGEPPIWVSPGDALTVTWTGAPAGAAGTMVVIYDDGQAT